MKNWKTTQWNNSKNVCLSYCLLLLCNNIRHVMLYIYICYWNTFRYKYINTKTKNINKSNLGYTALKQLATNIEIALRCSECDKPRLVFSKKKPLTKILIKLRKDTADLLFDVERTFFLVNMQGKTCLPGKSGPPERFCAPDRTRLASDT